MLYEQEVASKLLPEIKWDQDWVSVSAVCLAARIEHAKWLFRIYQTGPSSCQSTIVTFQLQGSVTWLKLIRGRWLLLASSDYNQSRLSLWDVAGEREQMVTQVFLSGPVMDGKCDDSGICITIALSIGTR